MAFGLSGVSRLGLCTSSPRRSSRAPCCRPDVAVLGQAAVVPPGAARRGLWALLLLCSVSIYGSHAPLLALCKVDGAIPFSSSAAVVLTELTKLLLSLLFLLTWDRRPLGAALSWRHVAPFALSALLYAANNNLVVHMQLFMDPSTFQILGNLKIASTALLYSLFLRRRLHVRQWLALCLLLAAGLSYSCGGLWDPRGSGSAPATRLHVTPVGLLLVAVYCLISGLSAVYTEAILKTQALPLSLQNLFLYCFGVLVNLVGHFWSGTDRAFLEGFSSWVLVIVLSQALNGLIMSVVMKHSSNITRLFVISCSILVNALLSVALFDLQLTPLFFIAVLCIGLAVHLYYGVT
ncbi:probable UDP-sugar transporter protein SLC35A4 [Excalfactoria chinensis]|uniref:probable UDP-sugar transporter protein SLC35A4 n=1 Tax=Excalfactoria chinensis TaxID=46218 RepID=UPI003B3B8798